MNLRTTLHARGGRRILNILLIAVLLASFLPAPQPAKAAPALSNNSFESGNLNGWTVASGNVEALQSTNFVPVPPTSIISPSDGNYMALVCNGPGQIDPAELDNLDGDPGPNNDNDRSILSQTFTVAPGDTPTVLTFDWNWLTSESPTPGNFDDFFMVTLNGANILSGSAAATGVSPFPDVPVDGIEYTVNSLGSTNGCYFNDGQSGWRNFSYPIFTPGSYTLAILVSDQGNADHAVDSGLLVDNFQFAQGYDLSIEKYPSNASGQFDNGPFIAGQELFWTVRLFNIGTAIASNVVVTDTLPAELTFLATEPFWEPAGGDLYRIYLGDIPSGEQREFHIKTRINPDAVAGSPTGSITLQNQVQVGPAFTDLNPANNTAGSPVFVQDQADLKVTKLVKPDTTVQAGDLFTYTIYVENLGPSFAWQSPDLSQGVSLRDEMLADGVYTIVETILDPDRVQAGPFYETPPTGGTTLEFDLLEDLEPLDIENAGRWVIQIVARANQAMDVNNCVTVFGRGENSTPDPDLSNNTACEGISVESTADLSTSVSPSAFSVNAGESTGFDVSVTNNGPSTAENVQFAALLPAAFVDGSLTVTSSGCVLGTPGNPFDPMRCNLGNLASGATLDFQITGDVDPAFYVNQPVSPAADYIDLDAWVTSDTFDPDNGNNLSTNYVAVTESADLSLRKFLVGTPVAGTQIHYEYQIANAGPSYSRNVTMRDFLPSQVEFVSAFVDYDGSGQTPFACGLTAGSNVLFCPLGNLPHTGAAPVTVFVNVRIKPEASGTLTNSADVNLKDTPDPDMDNNSDSAIVTVQSRVDLTLTKTSNPTPAIAGLDLFYTLTATNQGPSLAHDVVISDILPEGAVYSSDNAGCTYDSLTTTLTCPAGTLAPGESASVLVKTHLSAFLLSLSEGNDTTLVNQAAVTGLETELNPADNTVTQNTLVQGLADIAVTKLSTPNLHVQAGEVFTYTVLVDNFGPSAARFIAFQDYLFSSGTVTLLDVITDTYRENECVPLEGTIICALLDENGLEPAGTIGPDEIPAPHLGRWMVQIVAVANEAQDIHNLVTVFPLTLDIFPIFDFSGTPDPNMSNNQAQDFISVDAVADLALTKTDNLGPNPAIAGGDPFTYTLQVTNNGPSSAQNVVIADALPVEVELLGYASLHPVSCNTGTPLVCNVGLLLQGETATLELLVRVNPGAGPNSDPAHTATLQNNAWTYSETYDPDNANNLAHLDTGLLAQADLSVQKFGNPSPIPAGQPTSYDILYRNNGPSLARAIILSDVLPSGFEPLGVTVVDGDLTPKACTLRSGDPGLVPSVTCELGDLAPGASGHIVLSVRTGFDLPAGTRTNMVTISSATHDPVFSNNTATFATQLSTQADLSLSKTSDPASVTAGEQVKYSLTVTNNGPSLAENVQVYDTMPAGISYETGPTSCARVSIVPQMIACVLGDMLPGETRTVEIYARLAPDAPSGENLVNLANVESSTEESFNENNYASAYTYVEGVADLRVSKFGKPDNEVKAGTPLVYTIVVDNFGPSFAHQVSILDQIVASGGFELLDITSDRPAVCDPPGPYASQTITCLLTDPLEPALSGEQGRWIVTVTVVANEPGSIDNLARVTSADRDPDLSNNEAKVEHEISAVVDLAVTKTAVGEVLVNGELVQLGVPWPWGLEYLWPDLPMGSWVNDGHVLTYTLTITNYGPSTAQNIVVKDYLPVGVEPPDLPPTSTLPIDYQVRRVEVLPAGAGSCLWGVLGDPETPLECNLDSLPSGQAARVRVVIFVPKGVPVGTYYYNRARVYNDLFDPANGNNLDDLFTVVVPPIWLNFLPKINQSAVYP